MNFDGRQVRKGAADAARQFVEQAGGTFPADVQRSVEEIAKKGGTPLVVVDGARALGTIYLKDIVKGGIKERFIELRKMASKP